MITINILDIKTGKVLAAYRNIDAENATILTVKKMMHMMHKRFYKERQSFRMTPKSKTLSDETKLSSLLEESDDKANLRLYFKDLGPQVGWTTVFLTEYAGPPIVYFLLWWLRQPANSSWSPLAPMTSHFDIRLVALWCWIGHYMKRLLETVFVHRFSNATMPIANIFKNSIYYWGFAAFVAYFVNHPLYTPPALGWTQVMFGLVLFSLAELGNFSCHLALRNLRPPGTKIRRIPQPERHNPFTALFALVACPNYTYEMLAWCGFTIMTQCLPALLFMLVGLYQMSVWALGKLRNYRAEFPDFPRKRRAILPFIL